MNRRKQAGLSLLWVAVFMALFSFAAMAALFAMRYDRNLFVEAWSGLIRASGSADTIKKSQQAIETVTKGESSALRKCTVDGKVMYSNVECDGKNSTTKTVRVRDSQGFDAPQPPPPPKEDSAPNMQDKLIEKTTKM